MCSLGFGVTVGFPRLLTHRAFKTTRPIRATLAILGSAAIEGPVISWWPTIASITRSLIGRATRTVRTSTTAMAGVARCVSCCTGMLGGLFIHTHRARSTRHARDLLADPVVNWVDRTFVVRAFGGLLAAFGLGWLFGGRLRDGPLPGRLVGQRCAAACGPSRDL
jgi:stearoyl-CoA desaturase (Delta-9 desaturase)